MSVRAYMVLLDGFSLQEEHAANAKNEDAKQYKHAGDTIKRFGEEDCQANYRHQKTQQREERASALLVLSAHALILVLLSGFLRLVFVVVLFLRRLHLRHIDPL